MPTPSDPTPIPEKSYREMADRAQAGLDEQNRAVEACRAGVKHDHQASIGHEAGSEYGEASESSSGETEPDE